MRAKTSAIERYTASNPPDNVNGLKPFLQQELARIETMLALLADGQLEVSHAEPAKPRDGMRRYADGTDWNPGTGEGFYDYFNGAWNQVSVGGTSINTTAVGNDGSGEDNLISYVMPAGRLSATGKGVRITAWGTAANNANAKTLKVYFGSAVVLTCSLAVSIASVWRVEVDVYSTGTDTQDYISQLVTNGATWSSVSDLEIGTATQDDGAPITIKCTGEAIATNDIVNEGFRVTFN